MQTIAVIIAIALGAAGFCFWLYDRRERRPLRVKLAEFEDLCRRGIVQRVTWVNGEAARCFPDMIIVEGAGWTYEPFMDPSVSHTQGDVPAEVQRCFRSIMPHTDRMLRVLEMYRSRTTAIKYSRIDCAGNTLFMGLPTRQFGATAVSKTAQK